jgi:hypothetical protein
MERPRPHSTAGADSMVVEGSTAAGDSTAVEAAGITAER